MTVATAQTIYAYRSKDPVTVLKDWVRINQSPYHVLKLKTRCQGKNVGRANCMVIVSDHDDVYTMDNVSARSWFNST